MVFAKGAFTRILDSAIVNCFYSRIQGQSSDTPQKFVEVASLIAFSKGLENAPVANPRPPFLPMWHCKRHWSHYSQRKGHAYWNQKLFPFFVCPIGTFTPIQPGYPLSFMRWPCDLIIVPKHSSERRSIYQSGML